MSDDTKLPASKNSNHSVQLHNNGLAAGSLIETSLSRLNKNQVQNLMAKAAEEALRLEVKNREQNMDYIVGRKATEDHIHTFNMLDKTGKMTRQSVTSDIKTGAGNMRIESKAGATCFVASVAYDDPNHPDVMFLRGFRDTVLCKSQSGQAFIAWYWRNGPKLAKYVGQSMVLRNISRFLISRIVRLLQILN
ncbi:MAG: CFI-box-CTERM domain-containing protein [Gallionellaceae bacterium]